MGSDDEIATRQTRSRRRSARNIAIKEDNDGEAEFTGDDGIKEEVVVKDSQMIDAKNEDDQIKNRLLGRIKRTQEQKKETRKKTKTEVQKKPEEPKKIVSIPKKSSGGIPKKESKTELTSLLAGMKAPPVPSASSTPRESVEASILKPKKFPRPRSEPPKPISVSSPPVQSVQAASDVTATPNPQPTTSVPQPSATPTYQTISGTRKTRLLDSIEGACSKLLSDDDYRQLHSFSAGSIDLYSSFQPGADYDFFDVDAAGNLTLQPKIPIFPEDFPLGKKQWPLSWWGIVDPSIGQRTNRREATRPKSTDPQVVKPEVKGEQTGDKDAREGRESKRSSSRDRRSRRSHRSREESPRRREREARDRDTRYPPPHEQDFYGEHHRPVPQQHGGHHPNDERSFREDGPWNHRQPDRQERPNHYGHAPPFNNDSNYYGRMLHPDHRGGGAGGGGVGGGGGGPPPQRMDRYPPPNMLHPPSHYAPHPSHSPRHPSHFEPHPPQPHPSQRHRQGRRGEPPGEERGRRRRR